MSALMHGVEHIGTPDGTDEYLNEYRSDPSDISYIVSPI